MKRRELLLLLGGAMTAARALRAQRATPVIGFLGVNSPGAMASYVAAFHRGLSETGYIEGHNATVEYRWAEGRYDRLPALAAELVGRKVDVIATSGAGARAAKDATSTISIVSLVGDPIATGLYASLARPGGNLTGVSPLTSELTAKRLELLSELVPPGRADRPAPQPEQSECRARHQKHAGSGAREGSAALYLESRRRGRIRAGL